MTTEHSGADRTQDVVALIWDEQAGCLRLLDQTLLPHRSQYRQVCTAEDLIDAIQVLAVRGAPALGVAGAFGVVIALDQARRLGWDIARRDAAIDAIRAARPTAINLAWGVDRVRPLIEAGRDAVLAEARLIAEEDTNANRDLSGLAADWILTQVDRPRVRALTHCNAGALATSGWGTALGVLRELHQRDRLELVIADETRPLLQGSRLTAYELDRLGIPYLLQVDSAASSTILRGLVDVAVVGADRITAAGDVCNKIGTLAVALACQAAQIPFVAAAPFSTIDLALDAGGDIEIEERSGDEVTQLGGVGMAPAGARGFNPAFDITPARLVTAIATERGIVHPAAGERMSGPAGAERAPEPGRGDW